MFKEVDDKDRDDRVYTSTERGNYQKAIKYHEKHLKIAKEISTLAKEGAAYGDLGDAYQSQSNYTKAIEYHEKHLKAAKKFGDRAKKDKPIEISVSLTSHWVTIKKPLSIMKTI